MSKRTKEPDNADSDAIGRGAGEEDEARGGIEALDGTGAGEYPAQGTDGDPASEGAGSAVPRGPQGRKPEDDSPEGEARRAAARERYAAKSAGAPAPKRRGRVASRRLNDASETRLATRASPRPKAAPQPLDPAAIERAHAQFTETLLPAFVQWQMAVDKAAVRIGALHDDEVQKGMTLVPPPQIAVESIWQMFLAHGWVNENTGKWLATISCVTCIGVGYALPTAQLYFAQKRIAKAQAVRVGGNGQAHMGATP